MGRRRGFFPPSNCEQCGNPPDLGQSLWPGARWRCTTCLEAELPGKDVTSKAMFQTMEYQLGIASARSLESDGLKDDAEQCRTEAQWAGAISAEINERGTARTKGVTIANGEAVPPPTEKFLHDTLRDPDLVAVEASVDRSRLLLQGGTDVAAMGLDAANSIRASNSLEKMLAHQLVVAHKIAMEQIGQTHYESDSVTQMGRFTTATRFMAAFQQGLLVLHKLRQGGQQHITVQYVNVRDGGQAVIGNVKTGEGAKDER